MIHPLHQGIHLGKSKTAELVRKKFRSQGLGKAIEEEVETCVTCTQVNQGTSREILELRRERNRTGRLRKLDFTAVKLGKYS